MGERFKTMLIVLAAILFLLWIGPGACSDGNSPDIETRSSPA